MLESTGDVTLDGCPLREFADATKRTCFNIVIRISSLIVFMHVCAGAKATIVPRSVGMSFYYVNYVV
jgi:hypothetical protein